MVKTLARLLAVFVLAAGCFVSQSAHATLFGRKSFALTNHTGVAITAIFISQPGDVAWHRSYGVNWLAPGNTATITFDDPNSCTMQQLRVNFANGQHVSWRNGFNFCQVSQIDIWYNPNTNVVNAIYR